ncbi:hypothetical protein [Thiomicrorhabdus sp. 6S3-12]|uniref:hypothetical protein n=1 Tax=Thiomicrorhabdus sp. 6S3-12 TaxID=2819681 RepID=UPI001AAE04BA|nr:hypothetical protein [Thiomicrorhabdus sp. 6S3-12]MBO1924368.1 hypothetical protein [Thiomicrorhabdus sp. 6S3-12]
MKKYITAILQFITLLPALITSKFLTEIESTFTNSLSSTSKSVFSSVQRLNDLLNKSSSVLLVFENRAIKVRFKSKNIYFIFYKMVLKNLIIAVTELISKNINGGTSEQVLKNAIVGLLVLNKGKEILNSYLSIVLAVIVYFVYLVIFQKEISLVFSFFIIGLFISLYINQRALTFRINKGVYGNNKYEAKELMAFIEENFENDDFTDGSGHLLKIYPSIKKSNSANAKESLGLSGVGNNGY